MKQIKLELEQLCQRVNKADDAESFQRALDEIQAALDAYIERHKSGDESKPEVPPLPS